jgi:hypothetical protein
VFSAFSQATAICGGEKGETPAEHKPAFLAIYYDDFGALDH